MGNCRDVVFVCGFVLVFFLIVVFGVFVLSLVFDLNLVVDVMVWQVDLFSNFGLM